MFIKFIDLIKYIQFIIIDYHEELENLLFVFYRNNILYEYVKKKTSEEIFKWKFLIRKFPKEIKLIDNALSSDDIEIVKLGIKHGSGIRREYSKCLFSSNMDIIKLAESYGIKKYNKCLASNNMEVVQYGISKGANNYNYCLLSDNIDVVQLGISKGVNDFGLCSMSSNMEIVKLGENYGVENYNDCLISSNMDVVQYGISKGADNYELCLKSNNLDVVKLGLEKLGPKFDYFDDLIFSRNVDILLYYMNYIYNSDF